jgi:hypothetical protein
MFTKQRPDKTHLLAGTCVACQVVSQLCEFHLQGNEL